MTKAKTRGKNLPVEAAWSTIATPEYKSNEKPWGDIMPADIFGVIEPGTVGGMPGGGSSGSGSNGSGSDDGLGFGN